ncbi:Gp19/Gp15/Gp42 family protein [Nocardia wallacei]|uniref:Gp19/Gp15/Gp42 family protein n=1 Tax=Nocardia wallacei TaxID=480035 RepID=UPI002457181E|nr:Gp19/Gp15/Gp42 family protein [Nocardia wallacei]
MAYATPADVAARWRALSQAEQDRAIVLLDDAAWWLNVWFKEYTSDLTALAADNEELAEGLKILSCSMVRRALAAGGGIEGATQTQQVMGPFTSQVSYKNPDGSLFVYNAERDAILALLGANTSGAVSMTAPGL